MTPLKPEQCRAARALLDWSQSDLEKRAGVTRKTIAGFEADKINPYKRTLTDLRWTLEMAGVEFIDADNGGPGVRLKRTVVQLLGRQANASKKVVTFMVDHGGKEIECRLDANILDDWDRTNHKTRANFEQSFDNHLNAILVRSQAAIEEGRSKDGVLILTAADDFPETG